MKLFEVIEKFDFFALPVLNFSKVAMYQYTDMHVSYAFYRML